jgi:hypothetical protein
MLRLVIERLLSNSRGTWGVAQLWMGPLKIYACYTIELPWHLNKRKISCIPKGSYKAGLQHSPKFGRELWYIDVPDRDGIMIHPANYISQLEGCIALGSQFVDINGDGVKDVSGSKAAVERFMHACGGHRTMVVEVI